MINTEKEQKLINDLVYQLITTEKVDMTHFDEESTIGVIPFVPKEEAQKVISKNLMKEYSDYYREYSKTKNKTELCKILNKWVNKMYNIILFYDMTPDDWNKRWFSEVVVKGGGYDEY